MDIHTLNKHIFISIFHVFHFYYSVSPRVNKTRTVNSLKVFCPVYRIIKARLKGIMPQQFIIHMHPATSAIANNKQSRFNTLLNTSHDLLTLLNSTRPIHLPQLLRNLPIPTNGNKRLCSRNPHSGNRMQ